MSAQMLLVPSDYERTAIISGCGQYRYMLKHVWDRTKPIGIVCMTNPSRADAEIDDATVKNLRKRAKAWGWGGMIIINLSAWRSSSPAALRATARLSDVDPVGPLCDDHISRVLAANQDAPRVVAWGDCVDWRLAPGALRDRDQHVLVRLRGDGGQLFCFGTNASGAPTHPIVRGKGLIPIEAPLVSYVGGL